MPSDNLQTWIDTLGYDNAHARLHVAGSVVSPEHPYAIDIQELLREDGQIKAKAVFDIEGVPTVCFIEEAGRIASTPPALEKIRQRIWNQNLISVILLISEERLIPYPVHRRGEPLSPLPIKQANARGPFSAAEIESSDIQARLPSWFRAKTRVDHHLLGNLREAVHQLHQVNVSKTSAQN